MTRKPPCREDRIPHFLADRLTAEELLDFERHLESCEQCRSAIEDGVAGPRDWQMVRESLHRSPDIEVIEVEPFVDERRQALVDTASRLLVPSEDPRMMGRFGQFDVVGILGQGGMGIVFKGYESALNRYVAIKVLSPQLAGSALAKERFYREARAAAAVVHENVIAIHGVSTWNEIPYLVMPLIAGESLQRRLAGSGILTTRETLRIGTQIAAGLAAAHAQGLIHRDVKPGNILLEHGVERVVLTDFGLARAVDDVRLTHGPFVFGTPQYMSPEQANDDPLDFRTDLFSLGTVLYECCTGRPPFRGSTSRAVMRQIVEDKPHPIPTINADVPEWLDYLIQTLMRKNPDDRFASATEVEHLLRRCLAHVEQPTLAKLPEEIVRPSPHSRFLLPGILTMFFASILGFAAMLAVQSSSSKVDPPADLGERPVLAVEPEEESHLLAQAKTDLNPQQAAMDKEKYGTAQDAFNVGAGFYNARKFNLSREPFEAVLRLTDDPELNLKAHQALLSSYREIPEFEPFRDSAEYIIVHSPQDAERSLTRRSFVSFAYNRGQVDHLVERYEGVLKDRPKDYLAISVLSEIYTSVKRNPERSVKLLEQLSKLEEKRDPSPKDGSEPSPTEKLRASLEKQKLAMQYMQAKNYKKAAALYEEIAPLNPETQAWNLKEAALAHLALGNKKDALRLTNASHVAAPEARNDQLSHFYHRKMGDLFLELGNAGDAIPHYETALEKTKIEGYLKDTKASLDQAKEKAGKS